MAQTPEVPSDAPRRAPAQAMGDPSTPGKKRSARPANVRIPKAADDRPETDESAEAGDPLANLIKEKVKGAGAGF
ncbi:MAG TPA: hypothetical protein VKU01_30075, partial [Bryobacteraceae bacterium]|nr:hypothetical protein [Bryobacteraceae bacterium]